MKVLRTLILVTVIAIIGACGLLKEKNEAALASTYSTLYAFFETVVSDQIGCYPASNNNVITSPSVLKAVYSFQIERPSTLVVCVKDTTDYSLNNAVDYEALNNHSIDFFVSNTKINPGIPDVIDNIRIPNLGVLTSNPLLGSGVCPFNTSDSYTKLVGRYNMESLMDYQYIIAVDQSCGVCVGTGLSPFALARQYGVTF